MSGPSSALQSLVRMASASMDDDAPVSVARGWSIMNNLQHLIDMAPQHRINWCSTVGASGVEATATDAFIFSSNDDVVHYLSIPFVHTWIDQRWPCGLDIQIYGQTDAGGDMDVEARVVRDSPGSPFDSALDPLWEDSATISSATPTLIIGSIYYPGTTPLAEGKGGWRTFRTVESSKQAGRAMYLSRLEIRIVVTGSVDSTSNSGITAISVREFC